ncbi:MAG: Ig-like domain-containing protein [Treponema sp.]|jgi:hypothetical protein|nr:Ig-like domain-containing protein [Treponema sp.]
MKKILLLSAALLALAGCDILRRYVYEVETWLPGEGFHAEAAGLEVALRMSGESDRVTVEQAFTLSADGDRVQGAFAWEGRMLRFLPDEPLRANRDYVLTLGTGSRDTKGLSLEREFNAAFTTRPAGERPRLVSIEPAYGETLAGAVRVTFTSPLDPVSCREGLSFSPSIEGTWVLEDEGRAAVFVPLGAWKNAALYTITVSTKLQGVNGLTVGQQFDSRFTVGTDTQAPELVRAAVLDADGRETTLTALYYGATPQQQTGLTFADWESDTRLAFDFSEEVDTLSVQTALGVSMGAGGGASVPSMSMDTAPGFASRVLFSFAKTPAWESEFLFTLKPGVLDAADNESTGTSVFSARFAGPRSKPPALTALRIPLAPGKADEAEWELAVFTKDDPFAVIILNEDAEHFPYGEKVPLWIECYFDAALDARIDPFSVMELFSVEVTNSAVDFTAEDVVVSQEGFHCAESAPGFEDAARIEIRGKLTNKTNSGVIGFCFAEGLADSAGNVNENAQRISVVK